MTSSRGGLLESASPPSVAVPTESRTPSTTGEKLLVLIPLALSALVYFPITQNYFFADDFVHLYRMLNEGLVPYLVIPRGGHTQATFNALFYLSHRLFGTHAEAYYWLPLFVHLLNVGLLFSVIRAFTQSARLACFGAALWGISPMNEGALGWYSVFGQVLVAAVMLRVLSQLGRVADGRPLHRYAPALWCVLLLAACTSFGVGIGLTLAVPLAAFLFLPASATRTRVVLLFVALAIAVVALYFGLTRLAIVLYRPRIPPILYDRSIVTNLTMLAHLLGWGITTLLAGHAAPHLDFPGIAASVLIALFAAALVATLLTAPAPVKRRVLACLVLSIGCYAIIVAGRAAFFAAAARSQAFIRPPRYHYAGPIPLAIALCVMLAYLDAVYPMRRAVKNGLLLGWIVLAGVVYYRFGKPIDNHLGAREETARVLSTIRQAIDAAGPQQDVYIPNRRFHGVGPIFVSHQDIFPGWAGVFVIFFPDNVVDGKPVFFVTSERRALDGAQAGLRSATLLVAPPGD